MYDEFFGIEESEQFAFYRVPKLLFTTDRFRNLSAEAKLLYGLFLDRMSVSRKNGWIDENGRVYIIYTVESIMEALGCGNKKAIQLLAELENKADLILRKKQGLGKPNLIYVKKFTAVLHTPVERHFLKCENDTSGSVQTTAPEMSKQHDSYTDNNNLNDSENNPFFPSGDCGLECDGMSTAKSYREYFSENLEYEILCERHPYDRDTLEEILSLIVDTMCTKRKVIRIAGDDKPTEVVKSQFMKLETEHISYVLDCLNDNITDVRNPKQYLLAALYNAPMTMSSHYGMKVRHDMAEGKI